MMMISTVIIVPGEMLLLLAQVITGVAATFVFKVVLSVIEPCLEWITSSLSHRSELPCFCSCLW